MSPALDRRLPLLALFAALGFALLTSGGLVGERITHSGAVFALAMLLVTAGSIALLRATAILAHRSSGRAPLFAAQLVGLAIGIAFVHVAARALFGGRLVETAPQLVNDVVLGGSLTVLAWSFAAKRVAIRIAAVVGAFVLAALYWITARYWHVDRAMFSSISVQQYVAIQFVVAVLAMVLGDRHEEHRRDEAR